MIYTYVLYRMFKTHSFELSLKYNYKMYNKYYTTHNILNNTWFHEFEMLFKLCKMH
jgi:hypothetical protein